MKWATWLAVGLTVALAGCGDQPQTQSESDAKALRSRCDSLKRENETLKMTIDGLKVDVAAADRKLYGLKTENEALKRQLESARAAATKPAGSPAPADSKAADSAAAVTPAAGAGMGGGFAPPPVVPAAGPPAAAVGPSQAPPGLDKTVADLDGRIAALRTKVIQARTKITDLSRSTIDQVTPVPPGAIVKNDTVYRKESLVVSPHYQYVPLGPAIRKGDFRSQREKDDAVKKAKEEAVPLEQELRSLQAEQAAAKAKLLKLKAAAAPSPAPGEAPAQPVPTPAQPAENLRP
jgi:hypothetical protein